MIERFTLKGKAEPLPPRWIEGYRDGKEIALHGLPLDCGPYGNEWGSAGGGYGNGYAEGSLSGGSARHYCSAVINIFGTHE